MRKSKSKSLSYSVRKRLKITQNELAEVLRVSHQTVYYWEHDRTPIREIHKAVFYV